MYEACVIGPSATDILIDKPDGFPMRPGDVVTSSSYHVTAGGSAMNVATVLQQMMEKDSVFLISAIGNNDALGELIVAKCRERMLPTSGLHRVKDAKTRLVIVFTENENEPVRPHPRNALRMEPTSRGCGRPDREMIATLGAPSVMDSSCLSDHWNEITSSRIVFFSGIGTLPRLESDPILLGMLARIRQDRQIKIGLDTIIHGDQEGAGDPASWQARLAALLETAHWLVPSEMEAQLLSGLELPDKAGYYLLEKYENLEAVCIKRREQGVLLCLRGEDALEIAAWPTKVSDATGAGDAWCAGFLGANLKGITEYHRACIVGNAVAHFCIRGLGACANRQQWKTILQKANTHPQW